MRTPEMLEVWLADQGAATQVSAEFDDEMMLVLRPAVFQKLTKIGTLLSEEAKPENHFKAKMLKKLTKSKHHGQVKLVTYLGI